MLNVEDNFYELGGDSISMMKVISTISLQFGYEMKPTEFMERLTIETLAGWLDECRQDGDQTIVHRSFRRQSWNRRSWAAVRADRGAACLFHRQQRLFCELGGVSTHAYSELETKLDMERLAAAFNAAIHRHPMLRCIIMPDGKQRILDAASCEYRIETADIRALEEAARQERD